MGRRRCAGWGVMGLDRWIADIVCDWSGWEGGGREGREGLVEGPRRREVVMETGKGMIITGMGIFGLRGWV